MTVGELRKMMADWKDKMPIIISVSMPPHGELLLGLNDAKVFKMAERVPIDGTIYPRLVCLFTTTDFMLDDE